MKAREIVCACICACLCITSNVEKDVTIASA